MELTIARRKRRLKLLLGSAALLAALVLAEGTLRFLLFSPLARELGIGWRLRNEALFTAREAGRETWKLRAMLDEHGPPPKTPLFDARFGWLPRSIDPGTFASADEARLGSRRPVLLFGDSYAACVAEAGICWQGLLEQSPLARELCLLNYGVGGYGLDQIHLLMEAVLPRFEAREPLVIVGILVDDDLDRSYLRLRAHPKPYFTLEAGKLVPHALEHEDAQSHLAADPLRIRSYLWRWILFGSGLVPRRTAVGWTAEAGHVEEKQALNRRLLEEIQSGLARRGLDSFFVLFHAQRALAARGPYGWQEPFLHGAFEELGIPFVTSKRFLREHLARSRESSELLYVPDGPGVNHYTRRANEIVFGALLDGLAGRFEPYDSLAER